MQTYGGVNKATEDFTRRRDSN